MYQIKVSIVSRKKPDIPCNQEYVEHVGEQMVAFDGTNCQRRKMMAVVAVNVVVAVFVDDAKCNPSQSTVIREKGRERVISVPLITLQHLCNCLVPTVIVTTK